MLGLMLLLACGSGERPVRSEPTEPTVELGGEEPQQITWSSLEPLFEGEGPVLPAPLREASVGMPLADAEALHARIRQPGLDPTDREPAGGVRALGGMLKDHPDIYVVFLLDTEAGTLREVQLTLPADQAVAVLGNAWGTPAETEVQGKDQTRYLWRAEGLEAELRTIEDGRAILAYRRPEA